jgi:hypothetical protein
MKKFLILLLTLFALSSCQQDPEIIGVDADKKMPKVDVCHYDADTDTWKTLSINANALEAHLKHGDYEGECKVYTYVPDDGFEQQLIDKGYDDVLDDYVLTANIRDVTYIELSNQPHNTLNLIGIEDFYSLEELHWDQGIPILDLPVIEVLDLSKAPSLKRLYVDGDFTGYLKTVDLTGNKSIEEISTLFFVGPEKLITDDCTNLKSLVLYEQNFVGLDLTTNINLERLDLMQAGYYPSIDLSKNINLKDFSCEAMTIVELDLSSNINLNNFSIYQASIDELNLKNGNNINLNAWFAFTTLDCVQVDSPSYSENNWNVDSSANVTFSTDCGY